MERRTVSQLGWGLAAWCLSTTLLMGQAAQIIERGPHYRVIESTQELADKLGQSTTITNQVTELANGLYYWDDDQWKETEELIELEGTGAAAKKGPHKVIFGPNINTPGAIDLTTPDGQRFQSQIFGLSYLDTASGQTVLIAELRNSIGEIISSNQVIYPDAFTDFQADVRFTYTKAGFEQDIILRQNPPSPEKYGLNPETTHLQVLTEFFDPPQPKNRFDEYGELKPAEREFISDNLMDEKLEFGAMHIGKGKAFSLNGEINSNLPAQRTDGYPVGKQWDSLEGRHFLIESVQYHRLSPELEQLPPAPAVKEARVSNPNRKLVQIVQQRPSGNGLALEGTIKKLAQVVSRPGVVVDYVLLNTISNHTFKADTTYYVGGAVTLSGWTAIEGGTVVKYTNDAQIKLQGWVDCRTDPYRPAIFTSKDDDTIGDIIPGSTGNPYTNYYANAALYLDDKASELHHLRISYAKEAIYYDNDSGDPSRLKHVQLVRCLRGIQPRATPLIVQNVLMQNVLTNFYNATYSVVVQGEHLTVNQADQLNGATGTITLNLTNSLFIAVTNFGAMQGAFNFTNATATGILKTVGAAANYLVGDSSLRNAGTTNISEKLKAELAKKTTYAPILLTNDVTNAVVLPPQAQRDIDVPDIGYHYDPLDYVSDGISITAPLVLTNGVALAMYGGSSVTGYLILADGKLMSEGSAGDLNWLAHYNMVQEQYTNTWSTNSVGSLVGFGTASSTQPVLSARFTGWSLPAASGYHFNSTYHVTNVVTTFRDCQFFGGQISADTTPVDFFNNLLERVSVQLTAGAPVAAFRQHNNLHYGGAMNLNVTSASTNKDNQYFFTTISPTTGPSHSHNGYYTGADQLTPTNATDVVLTNWGFLSGPLGRYYHRTTSLVGKGSRTSPNAGLYHHTVRIEQQRESTTTVDIGFHYPAVLLTNIALGQIASQSSDYTGIHTATNGINGNRLGYFAHTQTADTNAWWQIDLGTVQPIDSVWIWNRTDTYSNRLSNFYLYVSPDDFVSNDPTATKAQAGVTTYFFGPPSPYPGVYKVQQRGRYVRIQQTAVAALNIYELEVYASLPLADEDNDGLPDYKEDLDGDGTYDTDETYMGTADSDGDGLNDRDELALGLDPNLNQAAQSSTRRNYTLDLINRIDAVTGVNAVNPTLDAEGNPTSIAP